MLTNFQKCSICCKCATGIGNDVQEIIVYIVPGNYCLHRTLLLTQVLQVRDRLSSARFNNSRAKVLLICC